MQFSIKDFFRKCDQLRIGHIHWQNPQWKIYFFAQWQYVYLHFKTGVFLIFLL